MCYNRHRNVNIDVCKDSGGVTHVHLSKNQKKRARKKVKKVKEGGSGGGEEREEVEGGGREEDGERGVEVRVVVSDPVAALKMKLEEAKADKVTL